MWCSAVSIDENDSWLGIFKPPLENYPSETLFTSSPSFQTTRAKSTCHMIHLKNYQWFSPYVLVSRWPGDISCSCLHSWDCLDFSNTKIAMEKRILRSVDVGGHRSCCGWAGINSHMVTWSSVRWQAGFLCLLWSHLWSSLERNSANAGVNAFSWECGSGMGSESKERGLWTWNMEEVSSQGFFCKVFARGPGKQESWKGTCVWSSRGLGNERITNPVMYGLQILAHGAGVWAGVRRKQKRGKSCYLMTILVATLRLLGYP